MAASGRSAATLPAAIVECIPFALIHAPCRISMEAASHFAA